MESYLADRTALIDASGIRKVFNLAATMTDPINFSIGQPDFDVPDALKQKAVEAIQAGANKYSITAGDKVLQQKIADKVTVDSGWAKPSVLVTSGVSGGLLLAIMSLVNPGDEVIIPDPYFVMYKHLVNLCGGKCVFVDSYPDYSLPVEKIAAAVTPKTKMIMLNSPSNPTGIVYSKDEIVALAKVAAKNDLIILSDEIYEKFCYDGSYESMAKHYDKTIVLNGFSKSYAMTGWRLGYAAVSETLAPLMEQMTKIQQYTFVCAPTPFQQAAIAALDYDISDFIADYKSRRDFVYENLKDKYEILNPGGAFYMFIKAPGNGSTAGTEFVEKGIKNNILMIPGSVFSEKDTHFRICYTASRDKLEQGVEVLRNMA